MGGVEVEGPVHALAPCSPRRGGGADAAARPQTFPVTEEVAAAAQPGAEFHVLGTVERQTLLKLLAHRVGLVAGPSSAADMPANDAGWEALSEALEQRPLKADPATDQAAILGGLAPGDRAAWLDLRPFMFRSPLLVQRGASLARALALFRSLGLRHLLVAQQDPRAIGLITRKDLTLENAQLVLGRRRARRRGPPAAAGAAAASTPAQEAERARPSFTTRRGGGSRGGGAARSPRSPAAASGGSRGA